MLRGMLEEVFPDVWIAGEISGVKLQPSGHVYFTLKDQNAVLSCVAYRSALRYLRFKPRDGVAVIARGRVDIWPPSGKYQLIVEALEPQGLGSLQLAFDQLKKQLAEEGLFDAARKRPLPALPQRIGIITSPAGAVIQDMLHILERRFAGLHIQLFPVAVQGEGSASQVCRALEYFSELGWADVVIVARGGGSLEDLWTFNEEAVARAIVASRVPVISAIGHETDYTISDFVADLRAPTPSAAADLVIQSKSRLHERFELSEQKLLQAIRYTLAFSSRRLHELGIDRTAAALRRRLGRLLQRNDEADFRLREQIRLQLSTQSRRLETLTSRLRLLDVRLRFASIRKRQELLEGRLRQAAGKLLIVERNRLDSTMAQLRQLSPYQVLERGYALVTNEEGVAVKDPVTQAPPGTRLRIRVAHGSFTAKVPGGSRKKDAGPVS